MDQYVRRHFVDRATFVRRVGGLEAEIEALLATGAAPGVVYSLSSDGKWWSALAAYVGSAAPQPAAGGLDWYAPAAIWWMRRAKLSVHAGASPSQASSENREAFVLQFQRALSVEPQASLNYPDCFNGDTMNFETARHTAMDEWAAWISGAYAVCLSTFTGESCVRKEVSACRIRNHFEGTDAKLALEPIELFDLTERLAAILMPFAPFERAAGTPGKAVDRTLQRLGLGIEEPYGPIDDDGLGL